MHALPLVLSAVLIDKPSRVGKTSSGLYVPGGLVPDKTGYYNSDYENKSKHRPENGGRETQKAG
jgi:hypothetical protein